MSNVNVSGSNANVLHGTITGGGTLTAEIDLSDYTLVNLIAQTTMALGTLSFYTSAASDNSGNQNYVQLKDTTGTNKTVGPVSGQFAVCGSDLAFLAGLRYVKIGITPAQNIAFKLPVRA